MRSSSIAAALVVLLTVLLGAVAVDAEPAEAATTTRIAGESRYQTAVAVSRANPSPLGGVVFVASGVSFADALAAGPVAAAEDGRLLLTMPTRVPDSVMAEIQRVGPREIVIVGGTSAESAAVATRLATIAPVTRIGGASRIETAFLLSDRLFDSISPTTVWVVSAANFADALAAGAVAARFGHALVLTHGPTNAFRTGLSARFPGASFVIAGGTASVPASVESLLDEVGSVQRIAGGSRYQTAELINRAFTASTTGGTMLLASGERFPDGLAATVLAGAMGVPLYLVPSRCLQTPGVPNDVARLRVSTIRVIGGAAAVSADAAALRLCSDIGPGDATRQRMLDAINAVRADAGVAPVAWNASLGSLAQGWSATMASRGSATHNPGFCATTQNAGFTRCGENIAWTSSSDPSAPMSFWTGSSAHYANMTNPAFTHVGLGVAQAPNGYRYWTQNFGG